VLTNISFTAKPGDRIGLVGENGTGKSTLLRVIAGHQHPDSGTVHRPTSTALLEQRLPYDPDTPITRLLDDAQHDALEAITSIEQLGAALAADPENRTVQLAYADALEHAQRLDAWSAEAVRGEMLTGLGLAGISLHRSISSLSGGQQLRLA